MVVNDFTLLPIIGNGGGRPYEMTVNDLTLLPIITNAAGRLDVITNIWEWWWTT